MTASSPFRFLAILCASLSVFFSVLSLRNVNDALVEPYTAAVARGSGTLLLLSGFEVDVEGAIIRGSRFGVHVRNGCNGLEAIVLFAGAVVAFPASAGRRILGLLLGTLAIAAVNLLRVSALYLAGLHLPRPAFDFAHTVVGQTALILFTIGAWLYWAGRLSSGQGPAAEAE